MAQAATSLQPRTQDNRKAVLVKATTRAIAAHGLSGLTLAKIGQMAGLTAAMVNFHFASKESLLLATLRSVAEEYESCLQRAMDAAGNDPAERLLALADAQMDPRLSDVDKAAVWYAFMAEASARSDYQRICSDLDERFFNQVLDLCRQLAALAPDAVRLDPEALTYGLVGLIDQLWQELLFSGSDYDRDAATRKCRAYLASVFPWSYAMPAPEQPAAVPRAQVQEDGLTYTLPAWVYDNDEVLALEREHLFLPSWQLVCHTSDLPAGGSYVTFDLFNARAFVIRDRDGQVRAFHNVCPHRAHSLVQDSLGQCTARLTCPYHGWTFALDGRRIGISSPETFPPHERERFGLRPLECEVLFGFVFIRFRPGGPSVREQFGPVLEEFAAYRTEDMQWDGNPVEKDGFWLEEVAVDWKNGLENYVEDYHFPIGHRGLSALMEPEYDRQVLAPELVRLSHAMRSQPASNWSARGYQRVLPEYSHLPQQMRRRWTYFALFPNTFLDLFPEKMDFMQMLPIAPGRMLLRGRSYALPDDSRAGKAARYLSDRINMRVQHEDNLLTEEVQKGLRSGSYQRGILSDKEILVRHFQDWVRSHLPVTRLSSAPDRGAVAARNRELLPN